MSTFTPQEHLIIIDGGAYLPTQWRLVWFREQHPNGRIETTIAHTDEQRVIVHAAVATDSATATGFGSATWDAQYPAIESAETKAIGRALAALGFGTQFAGTEFRDSATLADSPVRSEMPADVAPRDAGRYYVGGVAPDPAYEHDVSRPAEMEPTDRQRKLIEVLRSQLNLTDAEMDELATQHGGAPMATIGRKGISNLITELQRRKMEKADRARVS